MKYKVLKKMHWPFGSVWVPGTIVNLEPKRPILVQWWYTLSIDQLIDQWFIEEVKETTKPKYRVWDYAVDCENRFIKIFSVSKKDDPRKYNEVYTGQWFFWILEWDLRDPTENEKSLYFR